MDYGQIDTLNNRIERNNNLDAICDEVLDIVYEKYQKKPKLSMINKEIKRLEGWFYKSDQQYEEIKMFKSARAHLARCGVLTFLELWSYERGITWE